MDSYNESDSELCSPCSSTWTPEEACNLNLMPNLQQSEYINKMSISAQALRPSPYTIPPPRSHRMAYGSTSAGAACGGPLQQQPQSPYSISYATSSPTHPSGSALAFPGLLPGNSPPSMLPPASTSLHLPGSPSQNSLMPPSPTPRRHSMDGHDSPINPGSPLLDGDSSEDYKFRQPPICSMGISPAFNSFSNPPHQSPPLPPLGGAMAYPSAAPLCPTPMYNSPDACSVAGPPPPLGMSVWGYPPLPNMNLHHQQPKLSMDTPRFKLTPERAGALLRWFDRNKDHPYPTRHEKVSLCNITQLTYTQVSTWFANARRRMKKSNQDEEESRENSKINSDKCNSHNSSLDSDSWLADYDRYQASTRMV